MNQNKLDENVFAVPLIGTDPITKGTFTIEWAYLVWNTIDEDDDITFDSSTRAKGKIVITPGWPEENPLYKLAKEAPLRLQGLLASVDFGVEKRFIKIETIAGYTTFEEGGRFEIILYPVTFKIVNNLDHMENLHKYKSDNLL